MKLFVGRAPASTSLWSFFSLAHPKQKNRVTASSTISLLRPQRQSYRSGSFIHQKRIIKLLEAELGIQNAEEWHKIQRSKVITAAEKLGIKKRYEFMLKYQFNGQLLNALKKVYPSIAWQDVQMKQLPTGYMHEKDNQRKLFELIEKELGIKQGKDWYRFMRKDVALAGQKLGIHNRVQLVFEMYPNHSFGQVLQTIFPEYQLDILMFKRMQKKISSSLALLKSSVQEIEERLQVKNPMDWYRIGNHQIKLFSKINLIYKYGGVSNILKMVYPSIQWDMKRIMSPKKAQQYLLYVYMKELLPNHQIIEEYAIPETFYEESEDAIQLDVYVPDFKLGIEYNGQQHYKNLDVFGNHREYQLRDFEKFKACKQKGITLLIVPYTWDSSKEAIISTLNRVRPDIELNTSRAARQLPPPIPQPETIQDFHLHFLQHNP